MRLELRQARVGSEIEARKEGGLGQRLEIQLLMVIGGKDIRENQEQGYQIGKQRPHHVCLQSMGDSRKLKDRKKGE